VGAPVVSARETILGRVRASRNRPDEEAARKIVAERLAGHARHLQPARIALDHAGLVALFAEKAGAVDATLETIASENDVPEAVARYLRGRNLPAEAAVAAHPDLDRLDWHAGTMTVHRRAPEDADRVGINRPFCAVAETGTMVFASGPQSPATMNFLPETHIAVLRRSEIVAGYEDAWDRLRAAGRGRGEALPRTVNLVTGTSRTGDIEQILQLGVHGPRYVHILVIED
jgi:L-lactate dehydrogenase complex protein LldG